MEYLFINISVLCICVEVFLQSPAMPKGRRALQDAACRLCTPGTHHPCRLLWLQHLPKMCSEQGQGLGWDCWSWSGRRLSCVERLQTLPVCCARAGLCHCSGKGCGMSRSVSMLSHIQARQSGECRRALVGHSEPPESPWLAAPVSQPGKRWAVPSLAVLLCLQLEQGQCAHSLIPACRCDPA